MKIKIIMATYNSQKTIVKTLQSIKSQTYKNYELIIIDNKSTDNTISLIKKNYKKRKIIISKKDNGLYYAINKGLNINLNEDIIFILHSNDQIINKNCFKKIVKTFKSYKVDVIYGNINFQNKNKKVIRQWVPENKSFHNKIFSSKNFVKKLRNGWMPPHTSLFIKKKIFKIIPGYNTIYKISSDYDYILKIFSLKNIKFLYTNLFIVKMSYGGSSTNFKNFFFKLVEDYKIINRNKLGGTSVLLKKILYKINQLNIKKIFLQSN
jgi:glycosyltransferase